MKLLNLIKTNLFKSFVIFALVANFGTGVFNYFDKEVAPKWMIDFVTKVDISYMYTTNEMVRAIEKQYTKVTKKPNDFYPEDLVYVIDEVWPYVPDVLKIPSLVAKYNYINQYYNTQIAMSKKE